MSVCLGLASPWPAPLSNLQTWFSRLSYKRAAQARSLVKRMDIGSTKLSKSVSQFAFNFEMTVILNNDLKHEKGKCGYIKSKLSEPKTKLMEKNNL